MVWALTLLTGCNAGLEQSEIFNNELKDAEIMGKSITIPPDYNPADNDCGILTQVSASQYSGSDCSVTSVKNALVESVTTVGGLCTSNNVNKWAAFRPGYFTTSGSPISEYIFHVPNDGFRLGDFIGYNHQAKPPVYYYEQLPTSIAVEQWDNLSVQVELARGEAVPVSGYDKTKIDVVVEYGGVTEHNYVSVPAVGNYVTVSIVKSVSPINNGLMSIKPYYYVTPDPEDPQTWYDAAIIEDLGRDITTSETSLAITGTVADVPDQSFPGDDFYVNIPWSITKTSSGEKYVYARLRLTCDYFSSDIIYDMGQLHFTGAETKSGAPDVEILLTSTENTTVTINLEISKYSNFPIEYTQWLSSTSFNVQNN